MSQPSRLPATARPAGAARRGMALPTALLVLVVLTLLGTAAVFTSGTDLSIAGNARSEVRALSVAEAGVHEAFARLNMKDGNTPEDTPAGPRIIPDETAGIPPAPVATWSRTIVNKSALAAGEYQTVTGLAGTASALPLETTIRYKIEDGNESPVPHCRTGCDGEVVRFHQDFGYGGGNNVPKNTQIGPPVLQIESTYTEPSGAVKTILVEAVRSISNAYAPGVVRACGDVSCNGNLRVDGDAHPDLVAIVAEGTISTGASGCNDTRIDPNPSTNPSTLQPGVACPTTAGQLFQDTFGMSMSEMQDIADVVVPGPYSTPPSGTAGKIIYVTGETANNAWAGTATIGSADQPVIVVFEGNFNLTGNVTIYGVVYVKGNFVLGTGNPTVEGAIVAEGNATLNANGNARFNYNPDVMNSVNRLSPFTTIGWKVN